MKKKQYLAPVMQQMDVELQTILATSTPVRGSIKGDNNKEIDGLEYGGETKPGEKYEPW